VELKNSRSWRQYIPSKRYDHSQYFKVSQCNGPQQKPDLCENLRHLPPRQQTKRNKNRIMTNKIRSWEIWGCHSGIDEVYIFWGVTPRQLVKSYRSFLRAYCLFLQGQAISLLGVLDPEHEGTMLYLNVGNCLPNYLHGVTFQKSWICKVNISQTQKLHTFLVFR